MANLSILYLPIKKKKNNYCKKKSYTDKAIKFMLYPGLFMKHKIFAFIIYSLYMAINSMCHPILSAHSLKPQF